MNRRTMNRKITNRITLAAIFSLFALATTFAQLPQVHHLAFNESMTPIDRAVPGVPGNPPIIITPGVSVVPGPPNMIGTALRFNPAQTGVCRLNRPFVLNGDWTIEFWIHDLEPASSTGIRNIFGDISAQAMRCSRSGPGMLTFDAFNVNTVNIPVADLTEWNHIAIVHRTGFGVIQGYVNGTLVVTVAQPGDVAFNGTSPVGLNIGDYAPELTVGWNGDIDEFRVWSEARTATRIGLYKNGVVATASLPYVEEFGSQPTPFFSEPNLPEGWMQPVSEGPDDFVRTVNAVPAGPNADHTPNDIGVGGMVYARADDATETTRMFSPLIDVQGAVDPCVIIHYHSHDLTPGASESRLFVDMVQYGSNGATVFSNGFIANFLGDAGPGWQRIDADLGNLLLNTTHIQLSFRVRGGGGADGFHPVVFDDIVVYDSNGFMGEAPNLATRSFMINDSTAPGGVPAHYELPGPYTTIASPGDALDFRFQGQSNDAILLIAGDLNVGVVDYGPTGQLDIGGMLDPMTNVPAGLTIVGNGLDDDLLDQFFRTDVTGAQSLVFSMPDAPPGILTTFQAAFVTGTTVRLTNAVVLEIE